MAPHLLCQAEMIWQGFILPGGVCLGTDPELAISFEFVTVRKKVTSLAQRSTALLSIAQHNIAKHSIA